MIGICAGLSILAQKTHLINIFMLTIGLLKPTYTNEQILVILLTRLYFGTQDIEEIQGFLENEAIDWYVFYDLISNNDIRGFVYDIITVSRLKIDPQIHDTLKKDVMGITLLGSYQANLFGHLTNEFDKLGITVIPYKGRTLATRYYKAAHLRESSDIDFLIRKDDLRTLRKFLLEKNYTPKYNISEHQLRFISAFHREISFESPKDKMGITCSVELQWKLMEDFFGQFNGYDFFVQHLQPYTDQEGVSRVGLVPTYDFLCVASHHLIREPLLRFKYLIDLAAIAHGSSGELDWEELAFQFKQYNFSPYLLSGINALQDIIGLQLPAKYASEETYRLFEATKVRGGIDHFYKKLRIITSKQSFLQRTKLMLKVYVMFMAPGLNDLSKTQAPAWTIPFIVPVKTVRFLRNKLKLIKFK